MLISSTETAIIAEQFLMTDNTVWISACGHSHHEVWRRDRAEWFKIGSCRPAVTHFAGHAALDMP